MRTFVIASLLVGLTVTAASAERPPERREDADAVVVGKIQKIEAKESDFGGDGVKTSYTAEVKVVSVDRGDEVKVGDTIKVKWFRVTKNPSKAVPGAYGHNYPIKKDDEAKFWLMGKAKSGFEIIYNSNGVELSKKRE